MDPSTVPLGDDLVVRIVEPLISAGDNRIRLALDLLVKAACADAGYLVDHAGRVVARQGITAEEIAALPADTRARSPRGPRLAAARCIASATASPLLLVLCTRDGERDVDVEFAMRICEFTAFALRSPGEVIAA